MSLLEAVVLGVIQGLTEFLPISSTAHLRIVPALLKLVDERNQWNDPGAAASAIIQLGTLVAVLWYFWRDVVNITMAALRGIRDREPFATVDSRLAWYGLIGTIPIVVCGLVFEEFIESQARSLWIITAALVGLAVILYWAERVATRHRTESDVTWVDAIVMGVAQALALIPGSSRSGTTITAGLFLGLRRDVAARLSFLLSIPALVSSGLYQLYEVRHELINHPQFGVSLLVASVTSLLSGYAAIAFLMRYLRTHTTYLFIWYRLVLGGVLIGLLWAGKIQ
ncbi:MAG: undecaprenyl-diphosphate phosphatase [Acidobacteriota bacterium]|nr:undecaprenyl-diphosphate phosphatase [Blastocatellia bacterium]MDW8240503.1 undecaprenyl-diphosphate phosphatase [Acidobacteriota bacterium]